MSKRKRQRPAPTNGQSTEQSVGEEDSSVDATTTSADESTDSTQPDSTQPGADAWSLRSFPVQLAIVAVIALALRLLHVAQTIQVPTVIRLIGDAAGYFKWGADIAAGNWYGDTTFYQAPLYPYFLGVLMKFFGAGVSGIRFLQAVLGVAGVVLLGIAAKNQFGHRVGVLSAAMLAIYPAAIFYDGIIQKTSVAAFLLCAFLAACSWLAIRWKSTGRWKWLPAYCVGLSLGMLVLTRENALLWIPLIPIWVFYAAKALPMAGRVKLVAAFAVGAATILLPVAARNASLGGEWSPTTFQAGPNFYIGNNLQSDGTYRPLVPGHETPVYERADAQLLAEDAEGRELTAREVSRFWMNRSWEEIRQDPMRWVQLLTQKSFMVINRYEVPDVESQAYYRTFSAPLKLDSLWHFGVLFPLAVGGIVLMCPQWRELVLWHVLIASMIAAVVGFFIMGRYRFPLVPLLMPFAAVAIDRLFLWLRDRARNPNQAAFAKWPIIAVVVSAVLANLPVHDQRGLEASSLMNVAVSAAKAGEMQTCIRLLNQAVDVSPDQPEIHFNLGRALFQVGQPAEAIRCFQTALMLNPDLTMVDFFLAQSLEQLGQNSAALVHYRRAAQMDPSNSMAVQAIQRLAD